MQFYHRITNSLPFEKTHINVSDQFFLILFYRDKISRNRKYDVLEMYLAKFFTITSYHDKPINVRFETVTYFYIYAKVINPRKSIAGFLRYHFNKFGQQNKGAEINTILT